MVPVHPQPYPGRREDVRWVVPAGTLPFIGDVSAVPGSLATLLRDGTLAGVRLDPEAVVTTLAPGRSWSREGPRVRTAVHAAITTSDGWSQAGTAEPAGSGRDAELRTAALDLLDGGVRTLAASHGGGIELLGVQDGVVHVELRGACDGCPAQAMTLGLQFEARLRARCPWLDRVETGPGRGACAGPVRRLARLFR